jgi:hypothetical protein
MRALRALPKCPLSSNFHLLLNMSKPHSQNIIIGRRKLSQAQALILNEAQPGMHVCMINLHASKLLL